MTGENCRKFRLLTWTLLSQFIHLVGGKGVKGVNGGIVILASYNFHFIRVYDNLM